MNVTATPAPKSSILLEIEVPADRLDRAENRLRDQLKTTTKLLQKIATN